jgi:hypothetical protein
MGNKRQAEASRNYASIMKAKGIRRTTGRCCVCYRIISIPTDYHFIGGNCK